MISDMWHYTDDEGILKDLLREIFVRNARVSHIKSFLMKSLIHFDQSINDKEKWIGVLNDKKSKKIENESHCDDGSVDHFQDTLQD